MNRSVVSNRSNKAGVVEVRRDEMRDVSAAKASRITIDLSGSGRSPPWLWAGDNARYRQVRGESRDIRVGGAATLAGRAGGWAPAGRADPGAATLCFAVLPRT